MKTKSLLLCVASLFAFATVQAQTFVTQQSANGDSVSANFVGSYNVHNDIKSTGNPVVLKWNVSTFSSNVTAAGTQWAVDGICDNITCYSGGNYVLSGTPHVTDPYGSANFGIFYVILNSDNAPNNSTAWVRVLVRDTVGGTDRTLTFIANKNSTGVVIRSVTDKSIQIFPNPATDQLTVAAMDEGAVASFSIIAANGKIVAKHAMTEKVATIPVDQLSAGQYFVRFSDKTGNVVASRSFLRK